MNARRYTFNDGTFADAQDLELASVAPTVVEQVLRAAGWVPRIERVLSGAALNSNFETSLPAREQAWWPPAGPCLTGRMKACWYSFGAAWMEHLRHGAGGGANPK